MFFFFKQKTAYEMRISDWSSDVCSSDLCDGYGKCCVHKLEDEDTGELMPTNVSCRLLNRRTGLCSDYKHRQAYVPECVRLTAENIRKIGRESCRDRVCPDV